MAEPDARQEELALLEQMGILRARLKRLGAPSQLVNSLQVLLSARRNELYQQGVRAAPPPDVDLTSLPEEALLAELQQRQSRGLAELQQRQEVGQQVDLLRQMLDEGEWDLFLQQVPHLPPSLLAERSHWRFQIEDLDERFRDAIENFQLPVARQLLMVLAAIDKNVKAFDERRREYETLEAQVESQVVDDPRYRQRGPQPSPSAPPADLPSTLTRLAELLDAAGRSDLFPMLEALQAALVAVPQPARATAGPDPDALARHHREAEAQLARAFTQLDQLTPEALREAQALCKAALRSLREAPHPTLQIEASAGHALASYLLAPPGPAQVDTLGHLASYRDLLELAREGQEARRWLEETPIVGWFAQAQRIAQQARTALVQGQRSKGADLLAVSYALSHLVRHMMLTHWGQHSPHELPALATLGRFQAEVRRMGQSLQP